MATRNIVPRDTGEGSIGTAVKRWFSGFFDSIKVDQISIENNEVSPEVTDTVNLGTSLKRWLGGFFTKVTTSILALNSGGSDKVRFEADPSTGNLHINFQENSSTFTVRGKSSAGEDKLMIHTDPDFGIRLYEKGTNTFEIGPAQAFIYGGRPITLDANDGNIYLKGSVGGWAEGLVFQGSLGTEVGKIGAYGGDDTLNYLYIGKSHTDTGLKVYPDGSAELYFNGVKSINTAVTGMVIHDSGGNAAIISYQSGGWQFRSVTHGSPVFLSGENASGSVRNIVGGDPDAGANLYYAGVAALSTNASGISIADSSGHGAYLTNFGGTWQLRSFTHGAPVALLGEDATGVAKYIVGGDPDGPATLYNKGVGKVTTHDNGMTIVGSPGTSMVIFNYGTYWGFQCQNAGQPFYLQAKDPGGVVRNVFSGSADGGGEIWYRDTRVLASTAEGIYAKASSHGAGTTPQIGNIVYGTGSPPSAASVPEGTLFVKHV